MNAQELVQARSHVALLRSQAASLAVHGQPAAAAEVSAQANALVAALENENPFELV